MSARHHGMARVCGPAATSAQLSIASSTADALYEPATFGLSNGAAVNVVLTVNSGVWIGGGTGVPSLRFDNFGSGSTIRINNSGTLAGQGGAGNGGSGVAAVELVAGQTGVVLSVDNTYGYIFGGGGAGAVGATSGSGVTTAGGGGGGGGQGSPGGAGGAAPAASPAGSDGSAGTTSGGGAGGPGASNPFYGTTGETGGSGGGWGLDGGNTSAGYGGFAGNAITLNGNSIVWIAGNNGTQVRGIIGA